MISLKGIDPRMIANNITPYEPTHPGEILKSEIEFRGIAQKTLAEKMGVAYSVLNEILNCKRPLTAEYALLFEVVLGIDAEPLVGLQADYNLQTVRKDKSFSRQLANLRKVAAVL